MWSVTVSVRLYASLCALAIGCVASLLPPAATGDYSEIEVVECPYFRRENGSSYADRCLQRTQRYFRQYDRRLERNKNTDICGDIVGVRECLQPLLRECPGVRSRYGSMLMPVLSLVSCACDGDPACQRDLGCLEAEHRGVLFRTCDDYFKFNLKQKTKDTCFFLQESVDCKTSLVDSSCGARAGDAAFRLHHFLSAVDGKHRHCPLHRELDYQGFRYTADCPPIFAHDMAGCFQQYLRGHLLQFHPQNDLVVIGSKQDVTTACRSYRDYSLCMRPIKKACRSGTSNLYNHDHHLRKYTLKMDFICTKQKKSDYRQGLRCYQTVIQNQTLDACDHIWHQVAPMVKKVNAFQFFCQAKSAETLILKRDLSSLRACYQRVYLGQCGEKSAVLMGDLIRIAFQDPYYLTHKHRPNCKLHRLSPDAGFRISHNATMVETGTTETLHHRPSSLDGATEGGSTSRGARRLRTPEVVCLLIAAFAACRVPS